MSALRIINHRCLVFSLSLIMMYLSACRYTMRRFAKKDSLRDRVLVVRERWFFLSSRCTKKLARCEGETVPIVDTTQRCQSVAHKKRERLKSSDISRVRVFTWLLNYERPPAGALENLISSMFRRRARGVLWLVRNGINKTGNWQAVFLSFIRSGYMKKSACKCREEK